MVTSNLRWQDDLKAEQKVPITDNCYMNGKLLDGTNCRILSDKGASKSFMWKRFYLNHPSVHSLPKFALKTKSVLVENGKHIYVLFVLPVLIHLHDKKFEIYSLVPEIHDSVDLVLGIKQVYEMEDVINTRDSLHEQTNPFPKTDIILKPKEQVYSNWSTLYWWAIQNGHGQTTWFENRRC